MPVTSDPSARRFRIAALLSKGSSGRVYRAVMEEPDGSEFDVAIKLVGDDELRSVPLERLQEEARRFAGVEDRAIVKVDPPIRLGDKWALVMDLVTGVSLQRLTSLGPMPAGVVAEIVQEVARVLHKVWSTSGPDGRPLRILHRDVKPSNLQLNAGGELRILDFGIAKADFRTRDAQTAAYATGTRAFVSPERVEGVDTPAGDVYSLGVTAHVLLGDGAANAAADPASDALMKLVAKMRADSPDARPSAPDVEKACAAIRRRAAGETMREWAERNVPRAIAVRFSDRVVGTVLTATAARGAPPPARSEPPASRAARSTPSGVSSGGPTRGVSSGGPTSGASATPPTAARSRSTGSTPPRSTPPPRSNPPQPTSTPAPGGTSARRASSAPAADRTRRSEPPAPTAKAAPAPAPAAPPAPKVVPKATKSVPPQSAPSGRAAAPVRRTSEPLGTGSSPRSSTPPSDRADKATPATVARNLPDADLGPGGPGRRTTPAAPSAGTSRRSGAMPSLSPAPLFGPKIHDAETVAADAAAYSKLLDGDDPRQASSFGAGAVSLGTETVAADPPRPKPMVRRQRTERAGGGWLVGVVATGLLASMLVGGLGLVGVAGAWWMWEEDEALVFDVPAPPEPSGSGLMDDDEMLELLSQAPLPPPSGLRLTFSSVPLGADVYVDDRPVGQTPVIGVKVTEGKHDVVMVSDFERLERTIDVGDRKPNRFVWRGGEAWEEHAKR